METVIIALCYYTIQNEYNSTFSTQLQFHTTVIQLYGYYSIEMSQLGGKIPL